MKKEATKNTEKNVADTGVLEDKVSVPKGQNTSVKKKLAKKAPITDDTEVLVRSVCHGEFLYKSERTMRWYRWADYGDSLKVPVSVLREMSYGRMARAFSEPWIILEGDNAEDVIRELDLSKYYKGIPSLSAIIALLEKTPEEIKEASSAFSDGAKYALAKEAKKAYDNGQLTNYNVIKTVSDITGYSIAEQ